METTEKRTPGRSLRRLAATLGLALLAGLLLAGPAAGVKTPYPEMPKSDVYASSVLFRWSKVKLAYYEVRVFNVSTGQRLKRKSHIHDTKCTIAALPKNVVLSWDVRALIPLPAGPVVKSSWSHRHQFTIKSPYFLTFGIADPNVEGVIDENAHTIVVTVPAGTDRSALTPRFMGHPLPNVMVNGIVQLSGVGRVDFTNPVRFTLVAAGIIPNLRGSTNYYDVTVKVAASPAKAITAFSFQGLSPPVTGVIDEAAHTIAVQVPFNTNVSALIATFTTTGASVTVNGGTQISGVTPNNFTQHVTYLVTAADGSTQPYTVIVTVSANSQKAITAFSFQQLESPVTGAINEAAHTITVTLPFGTNVTALIATFTTTGASVTVNGGTQISGVTPNNFTPHVTYLVTAADGSTQPYVVIVSVVGNPAKAITAFSFQGLSPPVSGTIDQTARTIALTIPFGTQVTALVATFTTTGAAVTVAGAPQVSGVTANNFTNPVGYTVAASDGTTQTYLVTVTVAAYVPAQIDSVTPNHGLVGAQVTLTGSGFGSSGSVLFGAENPITHIFVGQAATIVSWSDTRIICHVPALSPRSLRICIKRTLNLTFYFSNQVAFTVDSPPV